LKEKALQGYLKIAAVALVAFAAVAAVQKHVLAVPVVGAYLPVAK
jgi:hypothetical protein